MAWTTLTADELNEYLASAQLRALRTRALAATQDDPLPQMIEEVILHVRNVITSAGLPVEAASGTFPEALKSAVAFLTLELAQTRLPGLSLTTEQKTLISAARGTLNKILARSLAVEAPATADYSGVGGTSATMQLLRSRSRSATGDALKKLS